MKTHRIGDVVSFTLTSTLTSHVNGEPHSRAKLVITASPSITIGEDGSVRSHGGGVVTDELGHFSVTLSSHPGMVYSIQSVGHILPQTWFEAQPDGAVLDLKDIVALPAPSPMTEYVRGASAYEVWLAEGNTGTVDDYLYSLAEASLDLVDNGNGTVTIGGSV